MVTIIGNRISYQGSNAGQANVLSKNMDHLFPPPSYEQVVRQTEFFNLYKPTSLREGKTKFKPALLHLIDLQSHPACSGGVG